MKWKLREMTLKSQIILLISISLSIVMITQFVLIYTFYMINQSNYTTFLKNIIFQLGDNVRSFEKRLNDTATVISFNQNTFLYANESRLSEKVRLANTLYLMFESIKASNSNVSAILLTDLDMISVGDVTEQTLHIKSELKRLFENGELDSEETRHMVLYAPKCNTYHYFCVTPSFYMHDGDGMQRLFTIIFYKIDSWKTSMSHIGWNEDYSAILLDTVGNVLGKGGSADASVRTIEDLPDDVRHIMKLEDGLYNTEKASYYKQTIYPLNWMIIGIVPQKVIRGDFSSLIHFSKTTVLMITILLILLGWYINRNITSPIAQITEYINQITSNKDICHKLAVKNNNEIGMIANEIDAMLVRINQITNEKIETQQQLYEAQMTQQRAQILAFQSQVNPHFLYNTLDCIHGMSYSLGVPEIAQMVRSLAHIFRYSIKELNYVKAKDELNCIMEYVEIIQIRYDNRFTINYNISPKVLDATIPKMILQPLNSVISYPFSINFSCIAWVSYWFTLHPKV
jgi:two-component system sensor histidine kinase YesM